MHLRAAREVAPVQGREQVSCDSQLDVQKAKGVQEPVSGLCEAGAELCRAGSGIRPSGHRSRPALNCVRLQVFVCSSVGVQRACVVLFRAASTWFALALLSCPVPRPSSRRCLPFTVRRPVGRFPVKML